MTKTRESGIHETSRDATRAASEAQPRWAALPDERKYAIIEHVRKQLTSHADALAAMAHNETGMGRIHDKAIKNTLAAQKTPGPEFLKPSSRSNAGERCVDSVAPYGVICAITPSTNPTSTIINNSISMLSAGNSVVFQPHPHAKKCSQATVALIDAALIAAGAPANCVTTHKESTSAGVDALVASPEVRTVVVTGGQRMVRAAFATGKKVIAAGPGNPPVIVDATADVAHAADCIIRGASFDNNIMCFAEKEIIAVESVTDELLQQLESQGAYRLSDEQLRRATQLLVREQDGMLSKNREFVGQSATSLLAALGVVCDYDVRTIVCETEADHPFVHMEMLMPVLPVVRARSFDDALALAQKAEAGHRHTAVIHSRNWMHINHAEDTLQTTIFVVNAPSHAGAAIGAEGYISLTIASPTGEGLTTCRSFARARRYLSRSRDL